jgi:hypothetical protein
MKARTVNVAILLLLVFELASGLGSFLVGEPDGRWMFWLHRAGGLALVVLLAWKASISSRSLRRRGLSVGTGLAIVGGVLFLGSLVTGLLWAVGGLGRFPVPVLGSWTGLSLHVALSLFLIPPFLVHLGLRWPRPGQTDLIGRRASLRFLGLLAIGFVLWPVQEALAALVAPSASSRRFTGSREEGSFSGNAHPVTNWLTDPGSNQITGSSGCTARSRARQSSRTKRSGHSATPSGRPRSTAPAAGTRSSAGAGHRWTSCWNGPG